MYKAMDSSVHPYYSGTTLVTPTEYRAVVKRWHVAVLFEMATLSVISYICI